MSALTTVAAVVRGEGAASALRRARERAGEAIADGMQRARGLLASRRPATTIINLLTAAPRPRFGGVAVQLQAALAHEARERPVALLRPGRLDFFGRNRHARAVPPFAATLQDEDAAFEHAVMRAVKCTGARGLHLEGTAGVPLVSLLRLLDRGLEPILSVHDFSLLCGQPHLFAPAAAGESGWSQGRTGSTGVNDVPSGTRHVHARELLERAGAVIFPSEFLRNAHQSLLSTRDNVHVVPPGLDWSRPQRAIPDGTTTRIAFAGDVREHKGGHLVASILTALEPDQITCHVFGGGDAQILQGLRRNPRAVVHGYYVAGKLPSLLAQHGIELALLPSIVPESFSLTLSECWVAGVPVVAFDHGAHAERIAQHGGGITVPIDGGSEAIAAAVRSGVKEAWSVPDSVPSARENAAARLALYDNLGLLRD